MSCGGFLGVRRDQRQPHAELAGAFVIALLITMCVWLDLDTASPLWLAVATAALVAVPLVPMPAAPALEDREAPNALTRAALVRSLPVAGLVCAPTLILMIGTLHEEFPFSGDHIHHLRMGAISRVFWAHHIVWVALFSVAIWAVRRAGFRFWAALAFAALVVWSCFGVAPASAARYPASGYFLDLPLQLYAHVRHWGAPLDAHRITTAASVPCWLLVLRPLVVRRWPDLRVLPFALFYFWQQDVVYYNTTAYLEPWSIVFVLTSVELLLSEQPTRSWLPVLLIGVAAGFKEQAILVLPWVGLATLAMLPRTARAWGAAALNGVLALLPFFFYDRIMRPHVARTFQLAPWKQLVSPDRVHVYGERLYAQFGAGGLLLLTGSLGVMVGLAVISPRRRWIATCLFGAAVTQVTFFYLDRASVPWTGYPRFQLFALALFGMAAWLPDPGVAAHPRFRTTALAASLAIAIAQLPTLASTVALAGRPDPARNYFEHFDSPVYFPIRALISDAGRAHVLRVGATITVRPLARDFFGPFNETYPTLRYRFVAGPPGCRCAPGRDVLLVRLPYPARLRAAEAREPLPADDARCLADVHATFKQVFERAIDNRPTGVLGVGCKPQESSAIVGPP